MLSHRLILHPKRHIFRAKTEEIDFCHVTKVWGGILAKKTLAFCRCSKLKIRITLLAQCSAGKLSNTVTVVPNLFFLFIKASHVTIRPRTNRGDATFPTPFTFVEHNMWSPTQPFLGSSRNAPPPLRDDPKNGCVETIQHVRRLEWCWVTLNAVEYRRTKFDLPWNFRSQMWTTTLNS